MTSLPIIDFSMFLQGGINEKKQVADKMRQASETIGFFMLSNIGIPNAKIEQAFNSAQQFFSLPIEQKEKIAWQNAASNRGYIGIKRETLNPSQLSDLKEAYNLGTQRSEDDPSDPAKNKWPENLPKFQQNIEPFITDCTALSYQILTALAIALDMPHDFFCKAHSAQQHTFRMLHYPALKAGEGEVEGENRAGAHTDYGSITLLFQDDVGGLEVLAKTGQWVSAIPQKGCIVVNIGDLMQRWTNDVLSSNAHRVVQPVASRNRSRYSMAYFCTPNKTEIIKTVPTCINAQRPQKYEAITTQDHMIERLSRTY